MRLDYSIPLRYLIMSQIGEGKMGKVYHVQDRLTQDPLALKIVGTRTNNNSTEYRLAIAHEFQQMASLRHPYIVNVKDYGFTSEKIPYFTMDNIPNARTIVEVARGLSVDAQLQLALQLLEALAYLHRRNILHHDLKPANVLVNGDKVQVVDFGLSTSTKDTMDGSSGGTLAYTAPEVLLKQALTPISELFSVGLMVYEMLSGSYPFPLNPAIAMINGILRVDLDFSNFGLPESVQPVLQKLVMKDPEQRYQSARSAIDDLQAALGCEQTQDNLIIRESYLKAATFVGRQAELAQLKTALDQTQAGQTQVWLLGGESGVGKTRLADELRVQALVQGIQVLQGQAVEGGGLPFQIWREPVRHLLLMKDINDLQAGILKEIVPEIALLLGRDIADVPQLEGKAHQQRLISSIIDLLRDLPSPVLLQLDDLQWTLESLQVLQQMLKTLNQISGLMVLGIYRNDERPNLPDELIGSQVLLLERLHQSEVKQLSQSILGEKGNDPQVLSLLMQETEGNTFFIVEVMRALADLAGQLDQITSMSLPTDVSTQGMQSLLQRRIQQMPSDDLSLLQFAAVAGRQLDLAIMQSLTSEEDLNTCLRHSSDAAILTIREGQWVFIHDKLREVILADLVYEDRQERHRQVAKAIETIYPDDANYHEILLEHWHQAGDRDKEIHYLKPVAENLIKITAEYGYAQDLLERGLQALAKTDTRRLPLLNLQADSYGRQGQDLKMQEIAENTLLFAQQAGDRYEVANCIHQLGSAAYFQGRQKDAQSHFLKSLAIRRSIKDHDGIAKTLNNLGALAHQENRLEEAHAYYLECIHVFQTLGNQASIGPPLGNVGMIAHDLGNYAQSEEYWQQSLVLSQELGDKNQIFRAAIGLSALAGDLGHYDQIRTFFRLAIRDMDDNFVDVRTQLLYGLTARKRRNDLLGIARSYQRMGWFALYYGFYDQALDYLDHSLKSYRALDNPLATAWTLNILGFTQIFLEDAQATTTFHQSLAISYSLQEISLVLESLIGFAWCYLQVDNSTRAAEIVGLVQDHPSLIDDVQLWINDLMWRLEEALVSDKLQVALKRGKEAELDPIVQELLNIFDPDSR